MSVYLEKPVKIDIPTREMKDGQIGVITSWTMHVNYSGRVVQRWGKHLITIGGTMSNSWENWFISNSQDFDDCRVNILIDGTTLVVSFNN